MGSPTDHPGELTGLTLIISLFSVHFQPFHYSELIYWLYRALIFGWPSPSPPGPSARLFNMATTLEWSMLPPPPLKNGSEIAVKICKSWKIAVPRTFVWSVNKKSLWSGLGLCRRIWSAVSSEVRLSVSFLLVLEGKFENLKLKGVQKFWRPK